ncbi:MAG: sensor histidine kinase [Arcticibacter sp.]
MTSTFDLEQYFEQSTDCLCIVGHDLIIRRANAAFSHALRYSPGELPKVSIMDIVHPDDQARTEDAFERMRQLQTLTAFENRFMTRDGEPHWFSWTAIPIASEQVYFGVASDIHHQRKLDEDRNLLLTNMTKSVEDLKQLTWATSHDLRSPVNNLLAVFSLLDVSKVKDPEMRKFIDMFKLATDNLRTTLDSYVDMLTEKEVLRADAQELDLEVTLRSVMKSLSSLIEHTQTEIRMDFSAFRVISFNEIYMESIFLNLLTNSIKYAKTGQTPKIFIRTQVLSGVHKLLFSDEGQGFDMDRVKDRVFGLHQTFHDHQESKGIGLYLVHHHVIAMGGRIQLESKSGEGATFIISFD